MTNPSNACERITFDGAPTGDLPRMPDGAPVPSVAVVERGGGCTFVEKVKNVQDAGYAGNANMSILTSLTAKEK
jgi:hypothetical protein